MPKYTIYESATLVSAYVIEANNEDEAYDIYLDENIEVVCIGEEIAEGDSWVEGPSTEDDLELYAKMLKGDSG